MNKYPAEYFENVTFDLDAATPEVPGNAPEGIDETNFHGYYQNLVNCWKEIWLAPFAVRAQTDGCSRDFDQEDEPSISVAIFNYYLVSAPVAVRDHVDSIRFDTVVHPGADEVQFWNSSAFQEWILGAWGDFDHRWDIPGYYNALRWWVDKAVFIQWFRDYIGDPGATF